MRNKLFAILAVLFFTFPSEAARPINNRTVNNPIGSATVPASSIRSGLLRTPDPIDTSSNLVVAGNVGGGRHFRGVVPYNAASDFEANLGSTLLDSFLRRSAGSQNFTRYTGRNIPYYSLSKTVTTTRPGRAGVVIPPTTKIKFHTSGTSALPSLSKNRFMFGRDGRILIRKPASSQLYLPDNVTQNPSQSQDVAFGVPRPMARNPQELESLILEQIRKSSQRRRMTTKQDQQQMEQFQHDLKQVSDKTAELKQSLINQDDSLRISLKKKLDNDVPQPFEQSTLMKQVSEEPFQTQINAFDVTSKQSDVYEQMQQQLETIQKALEQSRAAGETKEFTDSQQHGDTILRVTKRKRVRLGSLQKDDKIGTQPGHVQIHFAGSQMKGSLLAPHRTFASSAEDKFNQHIRAAEQYLKQGRFYRAADAYTLASIYKPSDPLAYAGKSHALFAAGEYMSSALFLSRALEIFPEYAKFKIDIATMVGDRDKLESRIADIEHWLQTNEVGELQFLLGYVYYQMNRLSRAKKAIDIAYEKMPNSPAVIALKKAIDDAIKL